MDMAIRTLNCILWVTLISASGYKCKHPVNFAAFFGYPQFDYPDSHQVSNYPVQGPQNRRSGVSDFVYPQESINSRSIPVSSNVQRVQEQERRRVGPSQRMEAEPVARTENGSYKIVNKYPVTFAETRKGQIEPSVNDGVVFPGPTRSSSRRRFIPEIPEDCKKLGICETVPDYPDDVVSTIVERLGDNRNQFKVDELEAPEIAQRIGPPDEVELCVFRERLIHPKAAPDKNGKWYYIINQHPNPLQGFRVEICDSDQSPCSKLAHFRFGHEAHCKQKYILRYMAGLDESGQMIEKPFRVPSCCSCVVKQVD